MDIQTKEYFNEEIAQLIKEMVPENTYGEFTELVHEIILRRYYTFNLSKEQIIKDINNLLENCEKIEFSSNFKANTRVGSIVLSKKLIKINSSFFEKNPDHERMYKTLTHEIYHGMIGRKNEKGKTYTGLEFLDESGNRHGIALNEVFNETAADLSTYAKDESFERDFYKKTMGYPNITFVVPLLAASLGVTVKEFAKIGIKTQEEIKEW